MRWVGPYSVLLAAVLVVPLLGPALDNQFEIPRAELGTVPLLLLATALLRTRIPFRVELKWAVAASTGTVAWAVVVSVAHSGREQASDLLFLALVPLMLLLLEAVVVMFLLTSNISSTMFRSPLIWLPLMATAVLVSRGEMDADGRSSGRTEVRWPRGE